MDQTKEEGLQGSLNGFGKELQLLEALKGLMNIISEIIKQPAVTNNYYYKGGTHNYYYGDTRSSSTTESHPTTANDVAAAAKECSSLMWGPASLAVIFGVSRDVYHLPISATDFERAMSMQQLNCPPGTIANAMRNNPYLKMHVSRWASMGAKKRVLTLAEEKKKVMNEPVPNDNTT